MDKLELPSYIQLGHDFVAEPIAAPDDNQLARTERSRAEEAAKITTEDVRVASIENDWVTSSLGRWNEYAGTQVDPEFLLDDKTFSELTDGLAPEYHEAFENAWSQEHAELIRKHLLQKQENDALFAQAGWSGFGNRLLMNLADPVNVLVTLATLPVSTIGQGGRLANAARTGAFVGAESAALESTLYLGDYSKSGTDMLWAFGSGAILGGLAGSLHKGSDITETMMEDLSRSASRALEDMSEDELMRSARETVEASTLEGTSAVNPLQGLREEAQAIRQERRTLTELSESTSREITRANDELADALRQASSPMATKADDIAFTEAELSLKKQALEWLKEYDKRVLLNEKNREKYPASAIPDPDTLEGDLRNLVADYLGRKADLQKDMAEVEEYLSKVKGAADDGLDDVARAAQEADQKVRVAKLNQKLEKLTARLEQQQKRLEANARKMQKWRAKREAAVAARMAEVPGVQVAAKERMDDSAGAMRATANPIEVGTDVGDKFTPEQKNYGKTKYEDIRYSIAAQFSRLKNPIMRWFGHHSVLDAPGRQGDATNVLSASEERTRLIMTGRAKMHRATNAAFKEWAKEKKLGYGRRDYHRGEFGRELAHVIRTDIPSNMASVNKAAGTIREIFEEWGELAKEAGVSGFENFVPNPNYLPRIINFAQFHKLNSTVGEGLYKLIEKSILKANPNLDPKYARAIAEGYINKLARLEAGVDFNMNNTSSRHTLDSIEDSLRAWRDDNGRPLDNDAISDIMDTLTTDRKKNGLDSAPARGKHRVLMDEDTSMELYDHSLGTTRTVRVDELFENNAEMLAQTYMRQMAGRIAAARINPEWFGSDQAFERFLKQARKYGSTELGMIGEDLDAEEELARFVWDHLTGRPLEKHMNGRYAEIARNIRDYNYMRLMGQVGWAQIPEFANVVGFAGWGTMVRHLPAIKDIMWRAKNGEINDELQEELELLLGTGADWLINPPGVRYDDFGKGSVLMEQGTRVTSAVSGMSAINTFLQRFTSRIIAQRFADIAQGTKTMSKAEQAQLGITDDMFKRINAQLLKNMESVPGKFFSSAKVRKLNVQKWTDREAQRVFLGAMNRAARKIIQENDIGVTARFMHSTTGKLLTQFRTFQSGAYEQQLLSNVALASAGGRDAVKVFQTFTLSTLLAYLAYVGQTYSNAAVRADRDEYLENRLKDNRAVWAGIARTGYASFMPGLVDTGLNLTGFDPLFAHSRTSMQPSHFILGNPTVSLGLGAYESAKGILSPLHDDYDYSEKNLRDQWGMAAWQNTLIGAAAFAAIKEGADLPRRSE